MCSQEHIRVRMLLDVDHIVRYSSSNRHSDQSKITTVSTFTFVTGFVFDLRTFSKTSLKYF